MFWSGGWDSTFMLLHALWTTNDLITAYYVEPRFRPQELLERQAIDRILDVLDSEKRTRVNFVYLKRPPQLKKFYCEDVGRIMMENYGKQATYVPQLDLFIYLARTLPLDHPAYGVETPAVPRQGCQSCIVNHVNDDGLLSDKVDEMWHPLRALSFPIIKMTKADMYNVAKQLNFLHILNMARTCINEYFKDNKMCGYCPSCKEVKPILELQYRFQL